MPQCLALGLAPQLHWVLRREDRATVAGAAFGAAYLQELAELCQRGLEAVLLPRYRQGQGVPALRTLVRCETIAMLYGVPVLHGALPPDRESVATATAWIVPELQEAAYLLQLTGEPDALASGSVWTSYHEGRAQRRADRLVHRRVLGLIADGARYRQQLEVLGHTPIEIGVLCNELEAEGLLSQLKHPYRRALLAITGAGRALLSTCPQVEPLPSVPEVPTSKRSTRREASFPRRVRIRDQAAAIGVTSEQYRLLYQLRERPDVIGAAAALDRTEYWVTLSVETFVKRGLVVRALDGSIAVASALQLEAPPPRYGGSERRRRRMLGHD